MKVQFMPSAIIKDSVKDECQQAGQKDINEFRELLYQYNSRDSSGFSAVDDWVKNYISAYYRDMHGRDIDID